MRIWAAATVAALMIMTAACGSPGGARDGAASVEKGFPIGILMPESKTSRYEMFDRPLLTQRLKELCPNCQVRYQNANQNSAEQQNQAEALVLGGARVLILDAVDSTAAGAVVTNAKSQGVAVVAYDRLASGPVDYYVSYDSERVGQVQGQALLTALKAGGDPKRGQIVMINGSPTDPNAGDLKRGTHSVLDGQVVIGQEYDTPDWSPDRAQQQMEQAITCCPSFVVHMSALFPVSTSGVEKPRRAGCRAGLGGHVVGGVVILSSPPSRRCARWTRRRWPCWRRTRRAGTGSPGC